jgi:hypothetical protein
MRKILITAALVALVFLSAGKPYNRTVRLTVVNKSDLKLEIRLTGTVDENAYYVRVPAGSKNLPTVKTVDVNPDKYKAEIMYIELWDPVYGYDCSNKSATLQMFHSVRMMIGDCTRTFANSGEPAMVKVGGARNRGCRIPITDGAPSDLNQTCLKEGR